MSKSKGSRSMILEPSQSSALIVSTEHIIHTPVTGHIQGWTHPSPPLLFRYNHTQIMATQESSPVLLNPRPLRQTQLPASSLPSLGRLDLAADDVPKDSAE